MKILVLPGDGIGSEIVSQAVRVLEKIQSSPGEIELSHGVLGGAAYDKYGHPYPPETQKQARAADAILLGCVGGPKYDTLPRNVRPEQGLLGIRKDLSLFANLRPAMLYPELAASSSLKPEIVAGLDIMIIRELTGDIYFGQPRGRRTNANGEDEGFDTMHYAKSEVERIARVGFETAMKRNKKLCSIPKSSCRTCMLTTLRCSSCARRNSST
jgi:3-isopropylmalate dehydrogenase